MTRSTHLFPLPPLHFKSSQRLLRDSPSGLMCTDISAPEVETVETYSLFTPDSMVAPAFLHQYPRSYEHRLAVDLLSRFKQQSFHEGINHEGFGCIYMPLPALQAFHYWPNKAPSGSIGGNLSLKERDGVSTSTQVRSNSEDFLMMI